MFFKQIVFKQVLLDILPLGHDPGSQIVIDSTDSGSDLKHLSLMLQEDVHLLAHLSSDALFCVQCTFKVYYSIYDAKNYGIHGTYIASFYKRWNLIRGL